MRLIPVIDLLNGCAVHAVRGDRAHYKPVQSVLSDSSEPLSLARAYRDRLGLDEVYVADLNAIQGSDHSSHRDLIAALVRQEGMHIILDAGTSDIANTRRWLDLGAYKVVIGTETLHAWDLLSNLPAKVDPDRLTFSLDFNSGKILSPCTHLATMHSEEILEHLQSAGWREVILLDLRRVGSRMSANRKLAEGMPSRFPGLSFLVGGGIASAEELIELQSMCIEGALVATALHRGIIAVRHISSLGKSSE
jgi:phosphoribosylformimino-5-aminoimidazole carboxamide ribotide isomerase